MVEYEQSVCQHEHRIWNPQRIRRRRSQRRLELPHRIVGKIPHHPTGKLRKCPVSHGLVRSHFPLQCGENIVLCGEGAGLGAFADGDFLALRLENKARAAADDRPTPALFRAFRALKEEGVAIIPQF